MPALIKVKQMGKSSSRRKVKTTTVAKGRLVEQIVAWMHDHPDVQVERNVRLLARGKAKRRREIDVLVSRAIAGYPVRIAIECKNEDAAIGSPKIDAFVGKLLDVGIPPQHGIFVSASGYTTGAIARAEEAGIRPLVLSGLNKEELSNEVSKAFQSIIYLLLQVLNYQANFENPVSFQPSDQPNFFDEKGDFCGVIPDLIWQNWVNGEIPDTIGDHKMQIEIPENWTCIAYGKPEKIISTEANVRIQGLVTTLTGTTNAYALKNASNDIVEKQYLEASFNKPSGRQPVQVFNTEQELVDFENRNDAAFNAVLGRIRLPRIQVGDIRWPISERVATLMLRIKRAYEAGLIPEPQISNIANIEGSDMEAFWEPIWSVHPASKARYQAHPTE
jgi:restriction endonuclease